MPFTIEVNHHFKFEQPAGFDALVQGITTLLERTGQIMATQAETAVQLQNLTAQISKVSGEVTTILAALEAARALAGETDPAVTAQVDALKTAVQGVDDLNPDAPPPVDPNNPAAARRK